MCYGVVACPVCGEWLDEFSPSTHECKIVKTEPVLEKPVEVVARKKLRN